jgi:hypothetical protein
MMAKGFHMTAGEDEMRRMRLIDTSPFSDFGWGPFATAFWNTGWRCWCFGGWIIPVAAWANGERIVGATSALALAMAIVVIRRPD